MDQKITLSSGKILTIQKTSFENSSRLLRLILKEVQDAGLNFDDSMLVEGFSKKDLLDFVKEGNGVLDTLFNSAINVITSEPLEDVIFECASRSTWGDCKISKQLFDDEEDAIGDYFEICFYVAKEHILPFFKNLSMTSKSIQKLTGKLKSPSQE